MTFVGLLAILALWIIPIALCFFVAYWVIRKAVCAGILDAREKGSGSTPTSPL